MATYIFTMDTCLGKGFISLDSIQYIDASDSEGYELSFANYADFKLKCTTEKIFKLDKFKNIGTPV